MKRKTSRALRASACMLALGLVAAGCGSDTPTQPLPFEEIDEVEFDESLGIDLSEMTVTESGLYYQDLVVGDGALAASGSEVRVHYRLRLRNGQQLETSIGGDPLPFTVDVSNIIPGFNEGVRGMRVGGERKLVIPPDLAYGVRGPEGILIFDVELVEVVEGA